MFHWLKSKYNQSTFVRNFAVMISGNGLSLIIPFILAPIITRIYSPEDFAGYELFASIVALFATVGSLRYEYAIILPKDHEDAHGLTKLCFRILIAITLLSALVLIPFREGIADLSANESLEELLWLVPFGVFFTGGVVILNQYLMRLELFKVMATNKVLATATNHGSKFGLGLISPNPISLSAGHVLGMAVPFFSLFRKSEIRKLLGRITKKSYNLRGLLKRYKQFPMFNMPHAFYDEGHRTALFFLVSIAYGEVVLGLFTLTIRYLRIPVQVFGGSMSQVFMPRLAKDYSSGVDMLPTVKKLIVGTALVGVLPFGLIVPFGEPIFGFVFGQEWAEAGKYAAILAPWLYLNFITSPVSMLPTIVGKQGLFFALSAVFLLLAIVGLFVMWKLDYPFEYAILAYTACNALLNLILIFWFFTLARKTSTEIAN